MRHQLRALLLLVPVFAGCCFAQTGGNLVLQPSTIDSGSAEYEAPVSITNSGSFVVSGSASVTLEAGSSIVLGPGFQATAGTAGITFDALVDPSIDLTISGQIFVNGSGLSGATVNLSGTTASGTSVSDSVVTGTNGSYSFAVLAGTYIITPSLSGYTFSPASQTFNSITGNQTASTTNASPGQPSGNAPGISGLSLPSGPAQMGVVITGTNFGGSQGSSTVTFNSTNLTVISWSDISIKVQIPAGTPISSGAIAVTVGGQTSTTPFEVTAGFGCS